MKTNEKRVFVEDLRVYFMIEHPEIADAVETRPNMFKSLLPYETRKRMVNAVETWQWFMRRAQTTPTDFKPQCPWDEWRVLAGAYLRATNPSFRR